MGEPTTLIQKNPFSPSAVAKIGIRGKNYINIDTAATSTAIRHLTEYLQPIPEEIAEAVVSASPPPTTPVTGSPRHGTVVALVGDYGTGKTHLAIHLLRQAEQARDVGGIAIHPVYLEASSGGFTKMYRDLISILKREDVIETVVDYYADEVAKKLERSPHTRDIAHKLRGRSIDPASAVEGFGLIGSQLARQLREELIGVTRNKEFGIALAMLMQRSEFADDVWTWLTCGEPSPALMERGITQSISGEELALEAMGVFAHLYGRRHHRFFLVIDEMDKILTAQSDVGTNAAEGFQRLFEVFQASGAFLIIVGLPDLFDTLGTSVQQRISHIVNMPALTKDNVASLITTTHSQEFGTATLTPFTEGAPELLVKLSDGTVRHVIRLCHRSYKIAISKKVSIITEDIIRDAARNRDDLSTPHNARYALRRVLTESGHSFKRDHHISSVPDPIDFWITTGLQDAGCAVIITQSVVVQTDVDPLRRQSHAIRTHIEDSETLLVVLGSLNSDLEEQLTHDFGGEPLEYDRHGFKEDFLTAVNSALERIQGHKSIDVSVRVAHNLDRIDHQQKASLSVTGKLRSDIEELRSQIDQLPSIILRELRGHSLPDRQPPESALPPAVAEVFCNALTVLSRLDLVGAVESTLGVHADPSTQAQRWPLVHKHLTAPAFYSAIGVKELLRHLVETFRREATNLYRESATPEGPRVQLSALDSLCRSYEQTYDSIDIDRLDGYPLIHGADPGEDEKAQEAWMALRSQIRSQLDPLGGHVLRAARPTLTGL